MRNKMKILIGYDGSRNSDDALWDLKKAGLPSQAEVLVISAADVFVPDLKQAKVSPYLRPTLQKAYAAAMKKISEAELLAKRGEARLRALFPKWSIKSKGVAESPAWAVIENAESTKPDIVVVGAHGHSKLGRFLGSVSQMVVNQANRSVRVGRGGPKADKKEMRIVVGLDGSSATNTVMKMVHARCWKPGTRFLLLAVIDPKKSTFVERHAPATFKWFFDQADDEATVLGRMLESYAKPLRDEGFVVNCRVRRGDPKHVLVEEAEEWGADGLFIGARGLPYAKRLVIGGVSSAVAARAHCSVEVVR